MLEPHGSPMKWPGTGAEEEAGDAGLQNARPSQSRTQDDAAVHYVFQREHQEGELSSLAPKQRWGVGDDPINENQDKWKNPVPITMHQQSPAVQLKNSQTNQQQFINQAIASSVGTLAINQSVIGSHPAHLTTNIVHTQLAPLQNHTMGNSLTIQNNAMMMPPIQGMQNAPQLSQQGLYDLHQHHANPMQAMNGIGKSTEHLMYLSQAGMLAPSTNQYLQQGQNQLGLTAVPAIRNQIAPSAKKLWDKGPGAGGDSKGPPHLPPLQLNPEQMWRDPTWSAQAVEHNVGVPMMGTRRGVAFPGGEVGSILSPRDTGGLGVKMVEYVLGGSPTGGGEKVAGVVAGLRGMVLEERPEDKSASPFEKDLHELHEHGSLPNGLHNGQEDDKAFNRTPGSRQPSPAEEDGGGGGVGMGGVASAAVRNGEAPAFPLLPPHAMPQPQPHLHLPHLSHPQPHPGMLSVAPLQGLPHPQHPQLHPGMTLNDSMNQHIELVLQMEQHPQFDNNSFASTQQYGAGVAGVAGVGGASGVAGVGGVAAGAAALVNGASVVQPPPDTQQHHQPFDVQMSINIEKITDPVGLGEGPHWDDRQQALFFVSLTENTIHKYVLATKKHTKTIIDNNQPVSFIIPVEGMQNHFVVAKKQNIYIVKWDGEEGSKVSVVKDLGELESVKPDNTINDGKADPRGRLFTGTFGARDPPRDFHKFKGGIFRLDSDKDHKIEKVWDEISLANGLAWDVKEKAMYYVDSLEYKIRKYDYDVDTGEISNLTYIFNLPKNGIGGLPDGMTIDTDGNIWLAVFNSSCVLKIDPRKGEVLQRVTMPVTQVTSVTFGGPNLDVLFVTTGNVNAYGGHKPPAGSTFMVTGLGVKGLPNVNFKYKL